MANEALPVVESKEEAPHVCKGCTRWASHGKDCWVYWEKKKACTMYEGQDPFKYHNEDPDAFWLL